MPREAAEEAKDAVAATAAAAGADAGAGLDMFADNLDADMFAETPKAAASAAPAKKALLDNYDDAEGYYNFQVQYFFLVTSLFRLSGNLSLYTIVLAQKSHCSQSAVTGSQLHCPYNTLT